VLGLYVPKGELTHEFLTTSLVEFVKQNPAGDTTWECNDTAGECNRRMMLLRVV